MQEWVFWVIPVFVCAALIIFPTLMVMITHGSEDSDVSTEWTMQVYTRLTQEYRGCVVMHDIHHVLTSITASLHHTYIRWKSFVQVLPCCNTMLSCDSIRSAPGRSFIFCCMLFSVMADDGYQAVLRDCAVSWEQHTQNTVSNHQESGNSTVDMKLASKKAAQTSSTACFALILASTIWWSDLFV